MNAYRVSVFVAICIGVVLFLYYPDRWLLIAVSVALFTLLLWVIAMKPVAEPDRAIVYRMAMFDHVAGPGYIFLAPGLDRIEGVLDMGVRELSIEVPQIRTADNQYVRTNLEVTWRIHPNVQGRVANKIRAMILMAEERRSKLVDEVVIRMARQVVSSYSHIQLGSAAAREAATATMAEGANEILESQGLMIDRIFWRGSAFPPKLSEAKLESAIRMEQVEALISSVEAVKKRLPDMQPEEFLALQAWLDMFRRGGFGPGQPPTPPKPS